MYRTTTDCYNKLCPPRHRYIMSLFLGIGFLVAYSILLAFSQAKRHILLTPSHHASRNICRVIIKRMNASLLYKTPNWTPTIIQQIDNSGFYTYIPCHFLAGPLVTRYSAKKVLAYAVLITGVATFSIPLFLFNTYGDYATWIIIRSIVGAASGIFFPVFHAVLAYWAPARDRGKLSAIMFACGNLGPAYTNEFSGYLIRKTGDPKNIFYAFGGIAAAWAVLWLYVGSSNYEESKQLNENERQYMVEEMGRDVYFGPKKIPWLKMLKSMPLWALASASIGHGIVLEVMMHAGPAYVERALGHDFSHLVFLLQTLPYLIGSGLIIIVGIYSDYNINKGVFHRTISRKICTIVAAMGPPFFMVAGQYTGCRVSSMLVLLLFALPLTSIFFCGTRINTLDLAPNFSAVAMGIAHASEMIAGLGMRVIVSFIVKENNIMQWRMLFWGLLFCMAISSFVFALFASGEVQEWNYVDGNEKKVNFDYDDGNEWNGEESYSLSELSRPGTSGMDLRT